MMKRKKITLCLAAAGLLAVGISGAKLYTEAAEIYDNTIRLHVLAASDSEEDQALKLTVRDALVKILRKRLSSDAWKIVESGRELEDAVYSCPLHSNLKLIPAPADIRLRPGDSPPG